MNIITLISATKYWLEHPISNLVESDSDIRDIVTHVLQNNRFQIPVVLLQIQFERLMLKVVDKVRDELKVSVKQLQDSIYNK